MALQLLQIMLFAPLKVRLAEYVGHQSLEAMTLLNLFLLQSHHVHLLREEKKKSYNEKETILLKNQV